MPIVAAALAVVGLIMALIPFVGMAAPVPLVAAIVLGIIALIRKSRGMGWSIGAIVVGGIGMIVAAVMIIISLGIFAFTAESESSATADPEPAVEAPATEEEPAAEEAPAVADEPDVLELAVVETAFGRDRDHWNYVVVLENPNADYIFSSARITVEALSEDGTILDSSDDYTTILSGEIALSGTFFNVGQGEVASIGVRGPEAVTAVYAAGEETGVFEVSDVAAVASRYGTDVTGTVSSDFSEEQQSFRVTVVARDPSGTILNADYTYIDRLPVDGKAQFQVSFRDSLPADATYEAYVMF
ncbi:MAG: hypothetical protein ACTIKT_14300 [Microbacterium sp.]